MSYIPFGSDFGLDVSRGLVSGMAGVEKFGNNPDVDAAEDVWSQGGDWVPPTAARVHSLVSSDAADDASPAGTGALTVTVYWLDGNYAEASEVVSMNGLVSVDTSGSYRMIHRMVVTTAGSNGTNVGAITATAATDGTVTAQIPAGYGQTEMAIYQVPASKTAYIYGVSCTMQNSAGQTEVDVALLVKEFGGAWTTKADFDLSTAGSSSLNRFYQFPLSVGQKGLIKLRVTGVTRANTHVAANFSLVLVNS